MNNLHDLYEEIIKEFMNRWDFYRPIEGKNDWLNATPDDMEQYFRSFLSSAFTRIHNAVIEKCVFLLCKEHVGTPIEW